MPGTASVMVSFFGKPMPSAAADAAALAEEAELEQLIEGGGSFFELEFYHRCGYIAITANAGEFVPSGIVRTDSGIYYKKCTVSLVEQ